MGNWNRKGDKVLGSFDHNNGGARLTGLNALLVLLVSYGLNCRFC